jgi:hypothetical protein
MHDYDRIQAEYESLIPELAAGPHEFSGEYGLPGDWGSDGAGADGHPGHHHRHHHHRHLDSPFSESEEMELAAELLDVRNEQELDHFLGSLISKAGKALGGFVKGPVGKALGGVLKQVAKTALPIAGKALGTLVGGPAGGAIGGGLASTAGDLLGLELEGLSGEDREFEVARQFVRFAGSAASHAAELEHGGAHRPHHHRHHHPRHRAHSAIMAAARRHAPGLLRRTVVASPIPYDPGVPPDDFPADDPGLDGDADADTDSESYDPDGVVPAGTHRRGTWIRRGRRIILYGV